MIISSTMLALMGLLLAVWTVAAAWMMIAASAKARAAEGSRKAARRMARMIDEAPAIPLLVRADGRIEGSERLAGWLGLEHLPAYLSELDGGPGKGLSAEQLGDLTRKVRAAQKSAAPFRMDMTPPGSQRNLAITGALADPQVSPGGSALLWVFDFSASQTQMARLQSEAERAKGDFSALVGIIEAAPMPMWFRGGDGRLRLVNRAYVAAVGAANADEVVQGQCELIESVDGLTAAQVAGQAAAKNLPIERIVASTIDGERRSLKVSDLPLGDDGVAGYAIDIEDMEEQARQYKAFRHAQRSMLDQISLGVGQFDAERKLAFANQPFRRIFKLHSGVVPQGMAYARFLSEARENGRTPEVRDFPAWRREREEWFASEQTREEAWPLAEGMHLRIVAQPMPDGGLTLIAEDRTEQLALSATRDTLLRTRTATFDSLFEALAVFAPDGNLQLWNRSFAGTWGLEGEMLDTHPSADALLRAIAPNLARPAQAKAVGDVIRAATLDRKEMAGKLALADGRTLEFAGVPLPDGNGLLTVLDVTANEKAEAALRERNQALEQADQVKTRFLANMSYELRTPLTSIGGFAELLQAGVAGDLSEQGREYVDAILESVARLTDQVENVLDLSQSEAGLLPLRKAEFEVLPFLTALVRQREGAVEEAGVSLDLRGNKATGRISGDERQLGRAIGHLLDNAIAATPKGGRIAVELTRDDGMVQIVLTDNGKGMDGDALAKALRGGSSTEGGKRQGLGLPLARQLIEAHGGTLDMTSSPGKGTRAIVRIP